LDIVARRGDVLHFVEVKARRARALTTPEDAITGTKFRALQRAATSYIAVYDIDLEVQFDAIAVEYWPGGHEIRYIPNAMTPNW
jgi:putative endonuclease